PHAQHESPVTLFRIDYPSKLLSITCTRGTIAYLFTTLSIDTCESSWNAMPLSASRMVFAKLSASHFFVCNTSPSAMSFCFFLLADFGIEKNAIISASIAPSRYAHWHCDAYS